MPRHFCPQRRWPREEIIDAPEQVKDCALLTRCDARTVPRRRYSEWRKFDAQFANPSDQVQHIQKSPKISRLIPIHIIPPSITPQRMPRAALSSSASGGL